MGGLSDRYYVVLSVCCEWLSSIIGFAWAVDFHGVAYFYHRWHSVGGRREFRR